MDENQHQNRQAAGFTAGRSREDVNQRIQQVWAGTFPDRSHEFVARLLGLAASGGAGWWVYENHPQAEWWELALVCLISFVVVSWFFTKMRRLTKLVTLAIIIVVALWLIGRFAPI